MRLEDKVALITGAASGMGASMARIFAREFTPLRSSDGSGKTRFKLQKASSEN